MPATSQKHPRRTVTPAPAKASPLSEYLLDPDPAKRERAQNWRMAIGLQKVDGLSVSSFLLDLARKNIEGRMTNEEVRLAIDAHYSKKKRLTSSPPELPATEAVSPLIASPPQHPQCPTTQIEVSP